MGNPKLRPSIEIFPTQMSDQRVLCMRDPFNYTDKVVFLPLEAYHILRMLDGTNTILDIQAEFMRRSGQFLYREKIEELLQQLDENLFMDSELFQAHMEELIDEFRASPNREAALEGKSYPHAAEELKAELNGYFGHPEGPGDGDAPRTEEALAGAIIPHIDYSRGGPTYAWAYREVMSRPPADVYVILGTAHVATGSPYVLTAKDFETPLGVLNADKEMIETISAECGPEVFEDELAHRGEHSVELQAVFLKYALDEQVEASIVPVLCGSFHQYVTAGTAPEEDPRVQRFIAALRRQITGSGKKVCLIASADLAHIGPRFGDPAPVDEALLRWIADEDMELLHIVETGDADGLLRHISRDGDRRRICGFPSIYTMLKVLGAGSGNLLKYSQWPDGDGTVTFASMVFAA